MKKIFGFGNNKKMELLQKQEEEIEKLSLTVQNQACKMKV